MMRKRGVIMLVIALTMGAVAVVLVNLMLKDSVKVATNAGKQATVPVMVAVVDMEAGTRLSTEVVKPVEWPEKSVPEGAYTNVDKLIGAEPAVLRKEVHKDEIILPYKLAGHGSRAVLAARIPKQMRAIGILVNEVRGVAGFVLPGDRVDVLATVETDHEKKLFTTRILVQNVIVMAVDQESSEKEEKPKVVNAVTLQVSKQQGQLLTLAQAVGELTLVLRNEADLAVSEVKNVTLADLKLVKTKSPVRRVQSKRTGYHVEVIRGLDVSNPSVKKNHDKAAGQGNGKPVPWRRSE